MNLNKIIASIFGIGFLKGGGTYAAIVTCGFIWLLWQSPVWQNPWYLFVITIIITLLGVYVSNKVEPDWGEDSSRVVIDEVAGMLIAVVFVPMNIYTLIGGLILFRFFDIVKPLGIRKMEALPSGTGVMMDDVLAGVYSNILVWVGYLLWLKFGG
ncbi:phosphatidylglycerophosphatase A family protein [Mucilaginibacter lappiensis]|uniref:Phosphatidylglycerophosphatase A n=1 Tax=Mucilaginibacter lappiensis TaxID=354630 RepID=A0A1N7G0F0_9SPHI|nr:phosphatidylglycerophosphatase A [Mucilaginibacter lappiensis]MBB6112723.1 phosphatidylglycerophosphatase A [Mucilaginibacter lappiensis]MBB6129747.1 phosphatidylglycerophosphatase A [Mucilaginibacter lappiensis]SIS05926.1 phosphatidylglycerophosphatase [Mucilaginibacter lappiensis]